MAYQEKNLVWLGNSREVLKGFPKVVRARLGSEIYRLQLGVAPIDARPMKTVGRGVKELRARDSNNQYRTIYVIKKADGVVIIHAFVKKSQKTSKQDIAIAKQRFNEI